MPLLDQSFDGLPFTLLETSNMKDKDTTKVALYEPMSTLL